MTAVVLDPELMESLASGDRALLERWLAAEGDHVRAGQVLAQARLLHQTLEVTAAHAGVLEDILVAGGQTFAPGDVLARLVEY